jgi:hypothetical protein
MGGGEEIAIGIHQEAGAGGGPFLGKGGDDGQEEKKKEDAGPA